jgi:hypothetical protein
MAAIFEAACEKAVADAAAGTPNHEATLDGLEARYARRP